MKISVIGLGPVGSTTAICFAKVGHQVIGVDIIKSKVNEINSLNKERLKAILNIEEAIFNSDLSFVCVETPCKKNGELDLIALKKVCKQIGGILKGRSSYDPHIVVIRSTMFPGSFEILKTILEKSSGKKCGKDFYMAINPEFLREKYAITDFFNPSFIVVGSKERDVGKKVMECYKTIKANKFLVKENMAQMIKYVNNSFHALKVSYANEIAAICKKINVNSEKLMELFCEDTQLNISSAYFKPGKAYGGGCLPKELSVLQKNTKKLKIKCPIINAISESNEEQGRRDLK